jgi:hypothetical protein
MPPSGSTAQPDEALRYVARRALAFDQHHRQVELPDRDPARGRLAKGRQRGLGIARLMRGKAARHVRVVGHHRLRVRCHSQRQTRRREAAVERGSAHQDVEAVVSGSAAASAVRRGAIRSSRIEAQMPNW